MTSPSDTDAPRGSRRAAAFALAAAGLLVAQGLLSPAMSFAQDVEPPDEIHLVGIVRDFHELSHQFGHPDFERQPDKGYGHYVGNVAATLDDERKPVFHGGGFKVDNEWRDVQGRPISHLLFDPDLGDVAGSAGPSSDGGIASVESFGMWFRDTLGVNLSKPLAITMRRADNGNYVFDDTIDPHYSGLGGFFPIEDQLFGNPGGHPDRNYHFTFELNCRFTYDAAADQMFRFIGDDDVFVFIDGKQVIDIGGVHRAIEQYVDLDRLGLTHGESYTLDFFFAERHRNESNFRIVTNLVLDTPEIPTISASYD